MRCHACLSKVRFYGRWWVGRYSTLWVEKKDCFLMCCSNCAIRSGWWDVEISREGGMAKEIGLDWACMLSKR